MLVSHILQVRERILEGGLYSASSFLVCSLFLRCSLVPCHAITTAILSAHGLWSLALSVEKSVCRIVEENRVFVFKVLVTIQFADCVIDALSVVIPARLVRCSDGHIANERVFYSRPLLLIRYKSIDFSPHMLDWLQNGCFMRLLLF